MPGPQERDSKSTKEAGRQRPEADAALEEQNLDATASQSAAGTLQRAAANLRLISPADVQLLQRAIGNQAVGQLIQAKGSARAGGDRDQKQAASQTTPLADSVTPEIQRAEEEEELQPKSLDADDPRLKPAVVSQLATPGPKGAGYLSKYGTQFFGYVGEESVDVDLTAQKRSRRWHADVNSITGNYTKIVQLPSGVEEVTGPSGNTDQSNYLEQASDMWATATAVDIDDQGDDWYMKAAVAAHEGVHESRLQPAMDAVEPAITASFESISVPVLYGRDASGALAAIRAKLEFRQARRAALRLWGKEYDKLIDNDHDVATPTAERKAITPMIRRINRWAATLGLAKWKPPLP